MSGDCPAYSGALPVMDGAAKVTGAVVLVGVINVLLAVVVSDGPASTPAHTATAPAAGCRR